MTSPVMTIVMSTFQPIVGSVGASPSVVKTVVIRSLHAQPTT